MVRTRKLYERTSHLLFSEFNYYRDPSGQCVLVDGATARSLDTEEEQCDGYESYWYERTPYRKIPYSSCEGGERPDRGAQHACPGLIGGRRLSGLFWGSVAVLPFACAAVAGYWWYTKGGQTGYVGCQLSLDPEADTCRSIRLGEHRAFAGDGGSGLLSTAASVPYFLLGLTRAGWGWTVRTVPYVEDLFGRRAPYRQVPLDDDAEVLASYEDE